MCNTDTIISESSQDGEVQHPGASTSDSDLPTNHRPNTSRQMRREAATTSGKREGDNPQIEEESGNAKQKMSPLRRLSRWITGGMEDVFERHGRRVASYPRVAVVTCMVVSALLSLGCLNFNTELRPYKLWIPQNSDFIKVLNWQTENFPSSYRRHMAVWEADNVLTALVVQQMWHLHNRVKDFVLGNNTSWENICARVPSLPLDEPEPEEDYYDDFEYGVLQRRRREVEKYGEDDMSLSLPRDEYCDILSTMPSLCLETSLLEIWGLDEETILSLTDEQVIEDFNAAHLSQVFGYKVNFTNYLGSITYDEAGRVVAAGAATHVWVTVVDQFALDLEDSVVDQGTGDIVDRAGMAWEEAWVETVLNGWAKPENINIYAQAASSFGVVSDNNIWGDVKWLVFGISIMTSFVNMALGRRNLVQQRPMLAFLGLVSVGQSVAISYGVGSMFGIPYCPVNSILPMLLIGLGVDDMFVIMAAWEASGQHKSTAGDLIARAGRTMRHAGVAITVTSLTDVTAFAVGATTDLPALQSFCLYAAIGIFAVYVLQATFFLAWLVRDEIRIEENRNGFLWCIIHKDWKPWACSQRDFMAEAFKGFTWFILTTPARVIILLGSAVLLGASVWASLQLQQEFNPMWFIPQTSYLFESFQATTKHFPQAGARGYIYFANVTLPDDIPKLNQLTQELTDSKVVTSVSAWFTALDEYINHKPEINNTTLTYSLLLDTLSVFLQSSSGANYRNDFNVDGVLDCSSPAPPITSFRIEITHSPASTPSNQAKTLRTVKSLVASVPIEGYKAAWAQAYSIWETNEVVGHELWRNMVLAATVVGIVTLILLASVLGSILVLGCVAATIAGVAGSMWLWGLTIDTVSCIALVLSIGLSVDYAAHITHAFLAARESEDKKSRASAALRGVGPAVFLGGLSTLLAFVFLAESSSHVFKTFFKVFTTTSVLGLFYGMVVLPVLLSLIGPGPYDDPTKDDTPEITQQPESSTASTQAYSNAAYVPEHDRSEHKNNISAV